MIVIVSTVVYIVSLCGPYISDRKKTMMIESWNVKQIQRVIIDSIFLNMNVKQALVIDTIVLSFYEVWRDFLAVI